MLSNFCLFFSSSSASTKALEGSHYGDKIHLWIILCKKFVICYYLEVMYGWGLLNHKWGRVCKNFAII